MQAAPTPVLETLSVSVQAAKLADDAGLLVCGDCGRLAQRGEAAKTCLCGLQLPPRSSVGTAPASVPARLPHSPRVAGAPVGRNPQPAKRKAAGGGVSGSASTAAQATTGAAAQPKKEVKCQRWFAEVAKRLGGLPRFVLKDAYAIYRKSTRDGNKKECTEHGGRHAQCATPCAVRCALRRLPPVRCALRPAARIARALAHKAPA